MNLVTNHAISDDRSKRSWSATVLTLFPEMFPGPLGYSVAGHALKHATWDLETINIRSFAKNKYGSVDSHPYGGGPGMIMRADILASALDSVISGKGKIVTYTIMTVPPEGFEEFAPYAWTVMELDGDSRLRISGFLPNIATPEDLPIGTPAEIAGFDERGIVLKKQ